MEFDGYLTATRSEGALLAAAAGLGLDAPVPSCPGWSVADLVAHVGMVHRQKESIVRSGDVDAEPLPPPGDDIIAWYREGLTALLDTLAAHDPSEPIWTWFPEDQTVGFWYRRMACETVVHRVDAELAHGVVTDLDAALAADATDEILRVFMAGYPDWADLAFGDRSVRLEAIDTGDSWTLRAVTFSGTSPSSGTTYEAEPTFVFADVSAPTTVVRGAAEDLLLFLWGRRTADGLEVEGDPEMIEDLREVAVVVTQ